MNKAVNTEFFATQRIFGFIGFFW